MGHFQGRLQRHSPYKENRGRGREVGRAIEGGGARRRSGGDRDPLARAIRCQFRRPLRKFDSLFNPCDCLRLSPKPALEPSPIPLLVRGSTSLLAFPFVIFFLFQQFRRESSRDHSDEIAPIIRPTSVLYRPGGFST